MANYHMGISRNDRKAAEILADITTKILAKTAAKAIKVQSQNGLGTIQKEVVLSHPFLSVFANMGIVQDALKKTLPHVHSECMANDVSMELDFHASCGESDDRIVATFRPATPQPSASIVQLVR